MTVVRTFAWAPQVPRRIDRETREVSDAGAWVSKVDADARAWGVCALMTDVTSRPERLLLFRNEADGTAGTACVTALRLRG